MKKEIAEYYAKKQAQQECIESYKKHLEECIESYKKHLEEFIASVGSEQKEFERAAYDSGIFNVPVSRILDEISKTYGINRDSVSVRFVNRRFADNPGGLCVIYRDEPLACGQVRGFFLKNKDERRKMGYLDGEPSFKLKFKALGVKLEGEMEVKISNLEGKLSDGSKLYEHIDTRMGYTPLAIGDEEGVFVDLKDKEQIADKLILNLHPDYYSCSDDLEPVIQKCFDSEATAKKDGGKE